MGVRGRVALGLLCLGGAHGTGFGAGALWAQDRDESIFAVSPAARRDRGPSGLVVDGNADVDRASPEPPQTIQATVHRPTTVIDTAAVTRWIEAMMGPAQFPAAAVVIVDASGPIYVRTFGNSGTERALTPDSRFYLGSTTKTMTGLAVQQLVEQTLVELDAPVLRYLPKLRFSDADRGARVTVEHLLRHTSGLPTIAAFNRRVQLTGRIDDVEFFAEPGAEVAYSSLNYQLLGELLEEVSGLPYATYMADRVFGPIGMTRTTADRAEAEMDGLVQGHSYVFGWPIARDEPRYSDRLIPAGYVISTPTDVGRYLALHLKVQRVDRPGLEQELETLSSPDLSMSWGVSESADGSRWSHAGTTPGFSSKFVVFPNEGLAVAVLTSRNSGPFKDAPSALLDGVIQVVRGEEPQPYFPWERILRIGLAFLILRAIYGTGRLHKKWKAMMSPRRMAHTTRIVGRVLFDVALAAALPLWIIRGVAKLPIQEFLEFYPDIGIALILFPALAIPAALLRSLIASEELRRAF